MNHYFDKVITSEMAGSKKPDPTIFNYALKISGAFVENSVMIGDDLNTDISGARKVNMKAIYFNPNLNKSNVIGVPEVKSLLDLKKLL